MILPRFGAALLAVLAAACASAPSPSARAREVRGNARATIEGRVVGEEGSPVAGISVYALPHLKDIPFPPPSITDAEGRFRLTVFAPAEYGFLLRLEGRTVVTPLPEDPAHMKVTVAPGERREGIEVVFLRRAWSEVR